MGGYDLYGNYYENSQDAWNAETSQMQEIDNRLIKNQLHKQELEIKALKKELKTTKEK